MTDSKQVNWPKGYVDFYKVVKEFSSNILNGRVLAIDPATGSTSKPGYSIYEKGVYVRSGVIDIPNKLPVHRRLPILYDKLVKLEPNPPDILVVELIRGTMSGIQLLWACGVTISAVRAPIVLELPANVWKALAKATPDYKKDDETDARMIGESLILLARRFRDGNS